MNPSRGGRAQRLWGRRAQGPRAGELGAEAGAEPSQKVKEGRGHRQSPRGDAQLIAEFVEFAETTARGEVATRIRFAVSVTDLHEDRLRADEHEELRVEPLHFFSMGAVVVDNEGRCT